MTICGSSHRSPVVDSNEGDVLDWDAPQLRSSVPLGIRVGRELLPELEALPGLGGRVLLDERLKILGGTTFLALSLNLEIGDIYLINGNVALH